MAEDEGDGSVGGVAAVASEAAVSHLDGDGGHPATNGHADTTKDLEKSPVVKLLSPVRTAVGETSTSTGTSMEERNGSNVAGPPPDSSQTKKSLRVWDYVCAELGLSVGAREDDPDMAVARERGTKQ